MAALLPLEAEVRLSLAPVKKALAELEGMLKRTQASVQAGFGAPAFQALDKVVGSASKSMTALASMTGKFTSAAQAMNLPRLGGDVSKLTGQIDRAVQKLAVASSAMGQTAQAAVGLGRGLIPLQSKVSGVGAEMALLTGSFSGVQRGAILVTGAARAMVAPIEASGIAISNIGASLNAAARAQTGFASAASRTTSAIQVMGISKLGGDVAKLVGQIDRTAQSLIKTSDGFSRIGGAAKAATGVIAQFVSMLGRIAVFSVVAGLIVRGFFAIAQAIKDTVSAGLEFNKQMEQGSISIAALLTSSRQLANATGAVVAPITAYQLNLAKARDIQQQLILLNVTTLGTAQELQTVFQRVLAFTQQQKATDQERLQLTVSILNATKLLGLNEAQGAEEARQILTLESARGQQILNSLGISIAQAREYQKQGTLVQFLNNVLSTYNIISGEVALTWQGLVSTVQTFFSLLAGSAFEQTFRGLKDILAGMVEEFKRLQDTGNITSVLAVDTEELKRLGAVLADVAAATAQWLADFINGLITIAGWIDRFSKSKFFTFNFFAPPTVIPKEPSKKVLDEYDNLLDMFSQMAEVLKTLPNDFDRLNQAQLNVASRGMVILGQNLGQLTTDLKVFARAHPEAAAQVSALMDAIKAMRADLDRRTASLEKDKKALNDVDSETKKMTDSLNQQLIALQVERAELALGTEAVLRIKLAKELANKATHNLAEAVIKNTLALEREKKQIKEQEDAWNKLNGVLNQQSSALGRTREGFENETEVLEAQNDILRVAIVTGQNWEQTQEDLAVAAARLEARQKAVADGLDQSVIPGLQDLAEAAARAKIENDELAESAENVSKAFLSVQDAADIFEDVIRGIAQGTADLSTIFQREGAALGATFIKGILFGKEKLEGQIIGNLTNLVGPHGIIGGLFAKGGLLAGGNFIGGVLDNLKLLPEAILRLDFGAIFGKGGILSSAFKSGGNLLAGALGFGLSEGVKALFGFGGGKEGRIGGMIGSTIGSIIGSFFEPVLGPFGSFIGSFLGDLFGSFLGSLFAHIPTKGTQIRKAVVGWLKDIGVSFADEVSSKKYFFEATKALAESMFGGDFLAASKQILTDKVGPELARQLQALGTFITADMAIKLGKSLEQTGTTFGNMLIANLGIERIPEAMEEIIQKSGISFGALVEKLSEVFKEGAISAEFYEGAIRGAVDLFFKDFPASIDVAKLAMESFTEEGVFDLEVFVKKFEKILENVAILGMATGKALTDSFADALSAEEAGANAREAFLELVKEALRAQLVQKFIEDLMDTLFEGIDLTEPIDLSSEAMQELADRVGIAAEELFRVLEAAGLLPEVLEDSSDKAEEVTEEVSKWAAEIENAVAMSKRLAGFDISIDMDAAVAFAENLEQQITSGLSQGVFEALQSGGVDAAINVMGTNLHNTMLNAILNALFQGLAANVVIPLLTPFIAGFAAASQQLISGMITAEVFSAIIHDLMAGIPAALEGMLPIFQAALEMAGVIADELGGAFAAAGITVGAPPPAAVVGGMGGAEPGTTLAELESEQAAATQDATDAIESFIDSLDDSTSALKTLIDSYIELNEQIEAATPEPPAAPPVFPTNEAAMAALVAALEAILAAIPALTEAFEKAGLDMQIVTPIIEDVVADITTALAEFAATGTISQATLLELQDSLTALNDLLADAAPILRSVGIEVGGLLEIIATGLIAIDQLLAGVEESAPGAEDAAAAFLEEMDQIIDEIHEVDSAWSGLHDVLILARDTVEQLNRAFEKGLITQEQLDDFMRQVFVETIRAVATELKEVKETADDVAESMQDFIDAGSGMTDLQSDLNDLQQQYNEQLMELRQNWALLVLSGEDVRQMHEDLTQSFINQARAMGEALVEDIMGPAQDLLSGIGDSLSDLQGQADATAGAIGAAFAAQDFEAVLSLAGDAIDAQIQLIEKAKDLQEAFEDLISSVAEDIDRLLLESRPPEERISAVGQRIGAGFAEFPLASPERQLEIAEELHGLILEQFDLIRQLNEENRDRLQSELEATRDANIHRLEIEKNRREQELQNAVTSLDEQIRAHEEAQQEIQSIQEEIASLEIQLRKEELSATISALDEQIRVHEQAQQDILRIEEQTAEERLRMVESMRDVARTLREELASQLLGPLSPLTPIERLTEIQRQFAEALAAARGGDTEAARRAAGLRTQLLEEASAVFASSQPFQQIFQESGAALEEIAGQLERDAQLIELEAIREATENLGLTGAESLEELIALRRSLQEELEGLDDTTRRKLEILRQQLGNLLSGQSTNIDEMIAARDVLVTELENLRDPFEDFTDEFEQSIQDEINAWDEIIARQTQQFDTAIADARDAAVVQLQNLASLAEQSRSEMVAVQDRQLAALRQIDTAVRTSADAMVNAMLPPEDFGIWWGGDSPIWVAIHHPAWVEDVKAILQTIAGNLPITITIPHDPGVVHVEGPWADLVTGFLVTHFRQHLNELFSWLINHLTDRFSWFNDRQNDRFLWAYDGRLRQHLNEVIEWLAGRIQNNFEFWTPWTRDRNEELFRRLANVLGSIFNRSVSYQEGGFIPAGVVSPAILHGPEIVATPSQFKMAMDSSITRSPRNGDRSVIDIDYEQLGEAVAKAMVGQGGPSQINTHIEVITEDGEKIVDRTIRRIADESTSRKIFIDARAVGKRRRL